MGQSMVRLARESFAALRQVHLNQPLACNPLSCCLAQTQRTGEGAPAAVGDAVEVKGWVRTVRNQKQFAFMQVGLLVAVAGLSLSVLVGLLWVRGWWEVGRAMGSGTLVRVAAEGFRL
jgi:hypothetical protein